MTKSPENCSYRAVGNLIGDATEGLTSITWTPYNKIRELVKTNAAPATGTTTLRYLYDAAGNRVVKDYHATQNTTLTSRTWTIRDAQGTVLAIYTRKPTVGNSRAVTRTEAPVHGSSRIGQSTRTATNDATASSKVMLLGTVYSRELCKRAYELVDHLGNVRATISDILVPRTATNTYDADILTLTDYYPFGMQMDIRTWKAGDAAGNGFGYNGKENNDEVKGKRNSLDVGARVYDPKIGRWVGVDPLEHLFAGISTFSSFNNSPIYFIDPDGRAASSNYDTEGNSLGTDNEGLAGKPIVIDAASFSQCMKHSEASNIDEVPKGGQSYCKEIPDLANYHDFYNHYQSLKRRPDFDGYLTKEETDIWWLGKSERTLFVDLGEIKLAGTTKASFDIVNNNKISLSFMWRLSNTGQVCGTLVLMLVNANTGRALIGSLDAIDKYDIDMDERALRNIADWIGRPGAANDAKRFLIVGYGAMYVPVVQSTTQDSNDSNETIK